MLGNLFGGGDGQRIRPLEWVLLAVVTLGVVFIGYHKMNHGGATATSETQASSEPSEPSEPAGDTGQTLANAEPPKVTPVNKPSEGSPSDMAGEAQSARPLNDTTAVLQKKSEVMEPARSAAKVEAASPPSPPIGQLLVTSNVKGAKITIDGLSRPNWVTPYKVRKLPAGSHRIVVSSEGYSEAQQDVTLVADQMASVNVNLDALKVKPSTSKNPPGNAVQAEAEILKPQAKPATPASVEQPARAPAAAGLNVQVTTDPPSAMVYADNVPTNSKTPTSFHLSPGRHTLIIFATGYKPIRRDIEVPETGSVTIEMTLAKH